MHWTGWIVVVLAVLNGGWMAYDGARALVVGDYTTPSTGAYAGQLGPWSGVVEAVGLAPRSTGVKAAFVVYGVLLLVLAAAYASRKAWARPALLGAAVLGLWYLPFGTLLSVGIIGLLLLGPRRA